ncbi:hypothetical protein OJAV_G00212410 [Oryzias javanicus]|uniref:Uncharacterized protein n=1 Tax=Oryzias javanicus TaxID=123683 RepID=A0A3S2PP35_ORYJA|nr:hypothetical protein OJAV_G00212410 [Oryzias javanicus]
MLDGIKRFQEGGRTIIYTFLSSTMGLLTLAAAAAGLGVSVATAPVFIGTLGLTTTFAFYTGGMTTAVIPVGVANLGTAAAAAVGSVGGAVGALVALI